MNLAPVDLALRHITETKNLLGLLITSSESFDYPKAKQALKELQRKVKELHQAQAALETQRRSSEQNITPVCFSRHASPAEIRD